jgi:hypothetical protein
MFDVKHGVIDHFCFAAVWILCSFDCETGVRVPCEAKRYLMSSWFRHKYTTVIGQLIRTPLSFGVVTNLKHSNSKRFRGPHLITIVFFQPSRQQKFVVPLALRLSAAFLACFLCDCCPASPPLCCSRFPLLRSYGSLTYKMSFFSSPVPTETYQSALASVCHLRAREGSCGTIVSLARGQQPAGTTAG